MTPLADSFIRVRLKKNPDGTKTRISKEIVVRDEEE